MQPAAPPADPILASSLWNAYQNSSSYVTGRDDEDITRSSRKRRKLLTGHRAVDEVLGDGLIYGTGGVCCVSSEEGGGGDELSQHLLISHLTSHPLSTATVIDTRNLDIQRLFLSIKQRLASQPYSNPDLPVRDIDNEAKQVLGRVQIMRAFDFEGVRESVNEVREELERRASANDVRHNALGSQDEEVDAQATSDARPGDGMTAPRGTVPDSQADFESDDEMLLNPAPPDRDPEQQAHFEMDEDHLESEQQPAKAADTSRETPSPGDKSRHLPPPHLLLITSLSDPLVSLRRSTSYATFQSLLSTFLRTLRHLTSAHPLLIIMQNTASVPRAAYPAPNNRTTNQGQNDRYVPPNESARDQSRAERMKERTDSPSILSSSKIIPQNQRAIDLGVDLHLLVQRLPRTVEDARVFYSSGAHSEGRDGQGSRGVREVNRINEGVGVGLGGTDDGRRDHRGSRRGKGRGSEFANFVEVLLDRHGGRTGWFGRFEGHGTGGLKGIDER